MYVHCTALEIKQANHPPLSIKHAFASGNFSNLKMKYYAIKEDRFQRMLDQSSKIGQTPQGGWFIPSGLV